MHPETHANLWSLFNVAALLGSLMLFCRFAGSRISGRDFFLLFVVVIVAFMVMANLPVRCQKPGCAGRMRHHQTQESAFEQRLVYRCTKCDAVFDTTIFGIQGGDGW